MITKKRFSATFVFATLSFFSVTGIAQNTFPCDGKLYFFSEKGLTIKLVSIDLYDTGNPVSQVICTLPSTVGTGINAMGLNPVDGFIYFIEKDPTLNPAEGLIRRLNSNCQAPIVCPSGKNPTIPFAKKGCFDTNGIYWVIDDNDRMMGFNLNNCNIVKGPWNLSGYNISNDVIYNPWTGYFYTGDIKIDKNGNISSSGYNAQGPGIALGTDCNFYSVGGGNADSIGLDRYDIITKQKIGITYIKPGSENGSDMTSLICTNITVNANFSSTLPSCAPAVINFTDSSSTNVTSWYWQFGDGDSSSQKNPSHTYTNPGTYTVSLIVSYTNGCFTTGDTITTQLVVPPGVTKTTSKTDILCFGNNNGSATVTATGGTSPFTYLWNTVPPKNTTIISGLSPGIYTITVSDLSGCTSTSPVTITEPPALSIITSKTDATCGASDGSATVTNTTGGTSPYSYQWSVGSIQNAVSSLSAGKYTVTITDKNGCMVTDSVSIINTGAPTASTVSTGVKCFGGSDGSASVTVSAGISPFLYSWSPGGYTTPGAYNLSAGTYTVTVTGANGCKVVSITTVSEPPPLTLNPSGSGASCGSTDGSASVLAGGGTSPYTYLWSNGSSSASSGNVSSDTYTVLVTDAYGCSKTESVSILITSGIPSAGFIMDKSSTGIMAPTITFTDQSSGTTTWKWYFGDGDSSSLQNPIHKYLEPGSYQVCLVVENSPACIDSTCKNLTVIPEWSFYISNAFTPDDDGTNDGFIGKGINVKEHQMWIFDRWGDLIYTTGLNPKLEDAIPWNGKANDGAAIAQQDVYTYLVHFKDIFDGKHRRVGSVTLIR